MARIHRRTEYAIGLLIMAIGISLRMLMVAGQDAGGGVAPNAPTLLTATPVSSTAIDLAWTDNASDEDGFKIERSTDGSSWSQIDTAAANATSYSDTGRTADTKYYYRVRAYAGSSNSAYTNWATAIPTTLLDSVISYWPLDEGGAATTREDVHGANNLTANDLESSGSGKRNFAAQFPSTAVTNDSKLYIADNASMSVGGGTSFTFSGWVRLGDKAQSYAMWGKDVSGDRGHALIYLAGSDRFAWHIGDGNTTIQRINADTFGSPSASTYYFVICWYDASGPTIGISVNGVADTAAATVTPADTAAGFAVGRQGDYTLSTTYFAGGRVDELSFWKKALSSAERTALYNSGDYTAYPYTDTEVEIDDDFNDNERAAWWTDAASTVNGTVVEQNQRTEISISGGSSGTAENHTLALVDTIEVVGDFDIQVDFERLTTPASGAWWAALRGFTRFNYPGTGAAMQEIRIFIGDRNDGVGVKYGGEIRLNGVPGPGSLDGSGTYSATSDTSGKLRIVRSGTTGTVYYWNGASWTSLHTGTIGPDDMEIMFWVSREQSTETVEMAYDNFTVNSGVVSPVWWTGADS